MFYRKFKFAPGDLVEDNHPVDCPLSHEDFDEINGLKQIFRVKEVFEHEGHKCLVLQGFMEDSFWCSGTFRQVLPSTESIEDMIKANQPIRIEEPVDG